MKYKSFRCLSTLVLLILSGIPAMAQPDTGSRTPPWLLLSFEQRTRFEHLTNPFRTNTSGTEKHFPVRTRLQLGIGEKHRPVRFFIELQDSRTLMDPELLYSFQPHVNKLDFLQAQLQFNLGDSSIPDLKSQITLGRFTMDLGKRRLSARNRMRNTTNAFDGISWTLAGNQDWMIHVFFTRPVDINPERLDSSRSQYFWGVFYESRKFSKINMDFYYFGLHGNDQTADRPRYSTFGGRFHKTPMSGTINYEVESVWQFGNRGAEDHFAHFQHAEMGYSLNTSWNPLLIFQYDYASGDTDPNDDKSGGFNTLLGARRFDFNPTGIYGPFCRSNINTPGIRIILNPTEKLRIMASHRAFWLASSRDAWTGSGFRDSTGSSGKTLGQNFETKIRWQTSSFLTVEFGYARFFKGSYLDRVPEGTGTKDSNFFYIETDIRARLLPY